MTNDERDALLRMSERRLDLFQQNLTAFEAGRLDGLTCPRCKTQTVNVRFSSSPKADMPSTVYFLCSTCGLFDTAQYRGKPPHYDSGRERSN